MQQEESEPFGIIARFIIVDAYFESKDSFDEVHDLAETPLEGSHDVFMHEEFPSFNYDNILPNCLDHSYAFPLCSLATPSPEHYIDALIDNPMICDLTMIWATRTTCLMSLVEMLIIFCP